MNENKIKWSQKSLITAVNNTTEFCVLDGVTKSNKRILVSDFLNSLNNNELLILENLGIKYVNINNQKVEL